MPILPADTLALFTQSLFEAAGVNSADATIVARSLVDANLCGHDSHGVMRAPQYIDFIRKGTFKPNAVLTVINETPAVLAADADWGLGQPQTYRLLDRLLPKAKALGLAAGTLRRCGHVGRLGEFAEYVAKEKMALVAAVNSHGSGRRVAPPGGADGRISTNPICMGAPTLNEPIVIDFGTSAAAEGKVRAQFQKRQPCPDGWLIDHTGAPSTDPAVLYNEPRGHLVPFGGAQAYKGFGLGLLIDMLCGGLSGGACSNPAFPLPGIGNAAVFIVLNPALFAGTSHFLNETDVLASFVRACPRALGVSAIMLPGDPERICRIRRTQEGIPIPEGTWELISTSARQLGIAILG